MAYPEPTEVAPWYLRNITQALALDETTGNVYVRTDAHIGNVVIEGDVNIPGNVNANCYQSTSPWVVTGNVIAELSGDALPAGKPWPLQVAQGLITGVQGLSISGYQEAVPTSWIPIWHNATSYTYFPSAQQVRVWSSSASDTDISVQVSGVDASYNILTETVTLTNGATGVLTSGSFLRVNSLALTRTPMNVGLIYAGSSDKVIELAHIEIGAGRSQMSIYTVPNGYTFYLTQANVYTNQVGSQTGLYRSYTVNGTTGVTNVILTFPFVDQYNSTKVVARPYPAKTDIQWQCQSSNNTSRMGAQIEGYLIATGY